VLVWKTLHILSMVTMVSVFIGAEIFYAAALWRRDLRAMAFVQGTVERVGAGFIGLGGILLGIVFGLLTAATGGFDFTAGWLIAAYVLVAAFFVNAVLLGEKVVRAGKAAMAAEEAGGSAEETAYELARNRGVILVAINVVLFTALIVDMVVKPL
jgi:uncharacterized membrane protein